MSTVAQTLPGPGEGMRTLLIAAASLRLSPLHRAIWSSGMTSTLTRLRRFILPPPFFPQAMRPVSSWPQRGFSRWASSCGRWAAGCSDGSRTSTAASNLW